MTCMLFLRFAEDWEIIHIHCHKRQVVEDGSHLSLERCWCIGKAERKHHKLIETFMSSKGRLGNILCIDPDLVVT